MSSFFGIGRLHFWVRLSSILDEVIFYFRTIGSGIARYTYRQSDLQKLLTQPISLICPSNYIRLFTNLLINHSNLIILLMYKVL